MLNDCRNAPEMHQFSSLSGQTPEMPQKQYTQKAAGEDCALQLVEASFVLCFFE